MEIKDFTPKYIRQVVNARPKQVITNERWNELFNLLITQGDYTSEAAKALCDTVLLNDGKHSNREDELWQAIQDIVNATIPSQSVTSDMLADKSVTKAKMADGVLLDKATNAQGIAGTDTNTIVTPAVLLAALKARDQVSSGIYTGSATVGGFTEVNLGFAPDAVFVSQLGAPFITTNQTGYYFYQCFGFATKAAQMTGAWSEPALTLTSTGFKAYMQRDQTSNSDKGLNLASGTFNYMAFRKIV